MNRKQFYQLPESVSTNQQRLEFHLVMKQMNSLLRVASGDDVDSFIYDKDAFTIYNNLVITLLSNATLHNQLAVKHFQRDLPESQKKPQHYKKV